MSKNLKNGNIGAFMRRASVPLMFIIICAFCIPISGLSPSYLVNEIVTRMGRNAFLILSLLIPIMAGMGLNFGMTLGAMAGEIGLILVSDWQIIGIPGMVLAMIISIPISMLLGLFCGKILNMAKGKNMPTSITISSTSYIYFVTDGAINSVKDTDTGFGVPVESPVTTAVSINGVSVNYHVYRTTEQIMPGLYNFTIA